MLKNTDSYLALSKNGNIDLLLFQALLKFCLYNTNLPAYHVRVVADLERIKARFPEDYRAYWMLANHYGFADDPFKSMREYEHLLTTVVKDNVPQSVLADFLTVNFYTFMYARCKATIDDVVRRYNIKNVRQKFWMYDTLLKQLQKPPLNVFLSQEKIYTAQRREKEVGFLCRALGIWIPVKSTWRTEALGLSSEGYGHFTITYQSKMAPKKVTATTISVIFQAYPKQTFEQFVEKILELPTEKKKTNELKVKWPASQYEYWDSKSFTAYGGGHGLAVFVKRPTPKIKGLAIEAPAKYPTKDSDGDVQYVSLGEGYTRFDGDIYYAFVLDCADQVFQENKKEFIEFLSRVLLD
jgi:hypothetical protein